MLLTSCIYYRVHGTPLNARTSHFFQWVGSLCGEFISLDGVTLAKSRFDYATVLILTDSTEFINKIIQVDIDHVKFNIRATEEPCHELFSTPISNNERRLSLSESSDADVDSENNPIGASGKRNENVSTSGLYLSEDNYIDHENSSATHDKQHQLLNQHHSRLSLNDSSATLAIQTDGDELGTPKNIELHKS
ncbi:hypothetical protein GH714_000962 [Hevea brasiliensis]|uniref:DUF4283 domain-containing protein n=1 Tax=Hevea brasiliensis TaxID=3981 RepID=A0A6A6KWF0_HEVBR|nr:hypothetical protein GH714_000962 [Hevea brasiliensis]